jgi:hypothetical protein
MPLNPYGAPKASATFWPLGEFDYIYVEGSIWILRFANLRTTPIKPTKVLFRAADKSKAGRSQCFPVRTRSITGERNS